MKLPIKIDHRFIYDADGKPIAMIAPTDNAAAVVASIIRAVNSHADLVAALEVTKTMLADQPIGNAIVDVATMQTLNGVIAAALTKLKG